jgi:hypothetical protein
MTTGTTTTINMTTTRTIDQTFTRTLTRTIINKTAPETIERNLYGSHSFATWFLSDDEQFTTETPMIRFLGLLVVLCVLVAGIGYYRGWFQTESIGTPGHDAVTVTVDKDKISQDKASAEQQVQNLTHK